MDVISDLIKEDVINLPELNSDDIKELTNDLGVSDDTLNKFLEDWDGSGDIQKAFQLHLKNSATSMNLFQIATKKAGAALKSLGGTLASMAIMFVVTELISIAVKKIDEAIHASENAIKAGEEAQIKIDEIRNDMKSMNSTIEESAKKFAQLSQGVDMLSGKNLSLNTDDYNEFLKISNNLAEIFPTLSRNYTENGDAIVQLSGDVDTIVSSLQNLVQVEKDLKKQEIFDQMDTVYKGASESYSKTKKKYLENINKRDIKQSVLNNLGDAFNPLYEAGTFEWYETDDAARALAYAYEEILEKAKIDYFELQSTDDDGLIYSYFGVDINELKEKEKDFEIACNEVASRYSVQITDLNGKIEEQNAEMKSSFSSYINDLVLYFSNTDEYDDLNDNFKELVTLLVNSLDIDKLESQGYDTNEKVKTWIQNNILNPLTLEDISPAQINEINLDLAKLFDMKKAGDISAVTFAQELQKKLRSFGIQIDILPVVADEREFQNKTENSLRRLTDDRGISNREDLAYLQEYTKDFSNEQWEIWLSITKSVNNATDAVKAYEKYCNSLKTTSDTSSLLSISDTVDAVNNNLKPALDALKTVYQSIFTSDGFTLNDVDVSMLESLKKSFADLKENGIDITTEDFENFTRVITDSSTTSDQAQQAFDDLATTLVENANVTLVTDDAFNTLVQTLETLGIVNAEEALQGLKEIQDEITAKGYDLANITSAEAAEFINEAKGAGEAVKYLRYYMIQKQLAETPLNTSEDVKALENLCDSLGITGEMYQTVISLKNSLAAVESGAPIEAFQSSIEYARKHIAELAKGDYEFGFKFKADPKSTSGSAKDIAEEFKNLLDAELKVLDTKMDAGLINFNDYIAQRLALIQKYYDEGKIKASDYYDYLSKHYETQLSYMDKVTSYVTTRIDKEIESYNKQINQIKEKYQTEIDYLDTVIDYYEKQKEALQDANTQRELQLALDKALYEFEKAQQNHNRKIYADNHGYIYRADGDAIRDAQDNLNKAKLDIQINEIEKAIKKVQEQQDALKKAMNNEVDALNKIIDNLEAYKEQWSSVAKEYEEKQNEMIAQQMLGADIERQILAGRLDILEDFKNKYLAIQQAIKDANANAAQAALNETTSPSNTGSVKSNSTSTTKPSNTLGTKQLPEDPNLKNKKTYSRHGFSTINKWQMSTYASGTDNARPGYHEVAENGDEIIRDNYGNAFVAKGHQLHEFEGGETVYNATETQELLNGKYIPLSSCMLSDSMNKLLSLNSSEIKSLFTPQNMPDFNFSKSPTMSSTSQREVIVTQNVNVTLPNVTNESGFNNFKKELDRLKLDAYQFANKRNK